MHDDHYAPPTTLLGLLQRGRGQGALIAAEDRSTVADLVHGCIRWEWRWDRQADHRDLYLARLIRDLELPLAPVVDLLSGDEGTRDRAAAVLERLARGGSAEARRALPDRTPEEVRPPAHRPERPDPAPDRDLPELVAELERRWVERVWCGPDELARGLARFGPEAAGAVSLLRRFWLATPHSYERADYLEALSAIGAPGMPEVYAESLYDCEPRARLLAVRHAPDRPYQLRRIAHLRDDPMEEPEVRAAAGARLAGAAGAPSRRTG
ncbi:hypothetical protein ABZW03_00255 [Kitasatospora sp. NPDC004799]|uniref:hypothetical protein n=1 Tax=Kitasatospora sp. NPDC004799 TaxID=3154460 RepID=UPI0033B5446A